MMYDQAARKYVAAHHAINKTRQIVMLYDGIIKAVNAAKDAINHNNIQERFNNLERATNIINGLQASIDFENGGEIAQILEDYYMSIFLRLTSVNHNNSTEICEHVLNELKIMRDAWVEVDQITSTNNEIINKETKDTTDTKNDDNNDFQVSI